MGRKKKEIQLQITGYSKNGFGIGKFAKSSYEVPHTKPGDFVQIQVVRRLKGRLLKVLEPASDRIQPRCVHFSSCGGCAFQHLEYSEQLKWKMEHVLKCFEGLLEHSVVHPIIACDPPWEYRNKMEYTFSQDSSGNRYLGLCLSGGRGKVCDLNECHLTPFWFINVLKEVKDWWKKSGLKAYHMQANSGSLRNLTLREGRTSGDKMAMLTVSGNPEDALNQSQVKGFVEAVQSVGPISVVLRIQQVAKGRPTQFYEMILQEPDYIREVIDNYTFHISPTAFFQPNTIQAKKLYRRAVEMAHVGPNSTVCDLYCGTGTLGLFAARQALSVIGIELSPEAVLDARKNAELNRIKNYEVHQGDVGEVLSRLNLHVDVAFVDPPRAGLDAKALKCLKSLQPEKILYISCNPKTQAENVRELISYGYVFKEIHPVDQFPQTLHIETAALLSL